MLTFISLILLVLAVILGIGAFLLGGTLFTTILVFLIPVLIVIGLIAIDLFLFGGIIKIMFSKKDKNNTKHD